MNIAFDATALISDATYDRGIGKYAGHIVDGIIRRLGRNDKLYLVSHKESDRLNGLYPLAEKRIIYLGDCTGEDNYAFAYGGLKELGASSFEFFLKSCDIDIYFSPWHSGIPLDFLKRIKSRCAGIKFIVTVNDLIPYVFPDVYMPNEAIRKMNDMKTEMLRHFDHIITISEASKNDIIKYAFIPEERISVIYDAAEGVETLPLDNSLGGLFALGVTKDYILYTGGDDYRKNIDGLIKAFALCDEEIKSKYQLVIVCRLYKPEFYKSIIDECNLSGIVILTGYVSDETLSVLYKNASLFIFPSLYEGFGMPVLEAMQYSLPVIAGDNSSMPELIGKNGVYFKADKVKDIARAIALVLKDEKLKNQLTVNSDERAALFSWDKCCDETFALFLSVLNEGEKKKNPLKNRRIKIAYLSPLNPEQSGISDYSEDLIPYLSKHVDMDIFTVSANIDNKYIKENFNIFPYEDFENMHSGYDTVIYQNGNSLLHWEILKYCRKYPGIIVMHDYNQRVFFDYLGNWMKNSPAEDGFILENFVLQYGRREGERLFHETKADLFGSRHIEFNRYAVANALGVIVHSDFAKNRILAHSPMLPVKKIYQGVPDYPSDIPEDTRKNLRDKLKLGDNDIVAATFGIIIPEKRAKEILEAVGRFVSSHDGGSRLKLVIAGKTWDGFDDVLREADAKYNIKNNVIVMGRLETEDFINIMYLCDFAFNLRFPTNGETSGCLSRLLAIGKPVIVTDTDAFSEYPADVCLKVPGGCAGEVEGIYNALCRLIKEPDLRKALSDNARKFMRENCSLEKVSAEYASFIKSVCNLKKEFYQPLDGTVAGRITDEYINIFKSIDNVELFCEALFRFNSKSGLGMAGENAEKILEDINRSMLISRILGA